MSEPREYKAITRFPMPTDLRSFLQANMPRSWVNKTHLFEFVDSKLAARRVELLNSGRAELEEQQRADHLLNVYLEWDKTSYEVTATYVFSSRDTAMLFKLALN